ncbi:MAG: hypothetical protein KKE23_04200 [Nanoarchaeota archaeon]|nr:hypothetical protein [Nanoarchaeota archaeon]
MVREDILNWLKSVIVRGDNVNDAAIKLIVAGHDMYEVNDALRQITSEIADEKFAVNEIPSFKDNLEKKPQKSALKPLPSKEVPELPKMEFKKVKKGLFSKKNILILIGTIIALMIALTAYLTYLMAI